MVLLVLDDDENMVPIKCCKNMMEWRRGEPALSVSRYLKFFINQTRLKYWTIHDRGLFCLGSV